MSRLVELRMHHCYIGALLLLYFGQWHGRLLRKSISEQLSSRTASGGSVSALSTTLPPKPRHLKISLIKFSDPSWAISLSASKKVVFHSRVSRRHRTSIGSYLIIAYSYLQRILTSSSPQESRLRHRNSTSSPNPNSAWLQ